MNIFFMCKRWEQMEADNDGTLRLVHEAAIRGHRVAVASPGNLTIRDNVTYANGAIVQKMDKWPDSPATFHKKVTFRRKRLPLSGFDVIFIRLEPPVDQIVFNFLDTVKNDAFIINDIDGLRKANNKIYTTTFDDDHTYTPVTHVSSDVSYLESVISETKEERMILKPLDGFGGAGVILLETRAKANIRSLLEFYVTGGHAGRRNYVILQEYVKGAEDGDIRILLLNGEPIGAMRRIPAEGDSRANVSSGGRAVKHTLTKAQRELCRAVGQQLVADGIYFAGIDVIGSKLIEVNCNCPGGIERINRFNKTRLQRRIVDFVEVVQAKREASLMKRALFRKTVEEIEDA